MVHKSDTYPRELELYISKEFHHDQLGSWEPKTLNFGA